MSTVEQIKKDILTGCKTALNTSGEEFKNIFKEVLESEYYGRYSPVEYVRTNQTKNAIKKSPVSSGGNSCSISIYYDSGAMSHPRPTAVGQSGNEHPVEYSEPEILTAVMAGYHMVGTTGRGAKTDNTWFETLAEFDKKYKPIVIKNLKGAGL